MHTSNDGQRPDLLHPQPTTQNTTQQPAQKRPYTPPSLEPVGTIVTLTQFVAGSADDGLGSNTMTP